MNVLEELKKLDAQREKLLTEAKAASLKAAQDAIADLNSLGYHYKLVEEGDTHVTFNPRQARAPSTGTRRSGMKDQVLDAIGAAGGTGIGRADLIEQLGVKGDKSGEQSVSNQLSILKKAGTITADGGMYRTK